MSHELIMLIAFLIFVFFILALDLGVFSRKNEEVSIKQAGLMSFLVLCISIGFYFVLIYHGDYLHSIDSMERLQYIVKKHKHPIKITIQNVEHAKMLYNQNLGIEFLAGYILEYALSIDNIFVILLIFTSFKVAKSNYHAVLFWGILGAIVMRMLFIFIGAALINKFGWILYIFGVFLVYTGIKMYLDRNKHDEFDTHDHPVIKFANKHFKIHPRFEEDKFFIKIDHVWKVTPLFLVLIIIEFTDLIFAVDSIPTIFSVTKDPYIVFFSNIFSIIALRSMFFLLAGIIDKLRYLKIGLAVLLTFIGLKMLLHHYMNLIGFQTIHSLMIILLILGTSVIASLLNPAKGEAKD